MNYNMILVKFTLFVHLCDQVHLASETLELVHVVFRHGHRTPSAAELYPSSPYYNESNYLPYGYTQLTNEGKKRCYAIGSALKQRYNGFLNATYHYSLIEARSTDFERCKESLLLVLNGMFPPTEELTWKEGENWLPFATIYDEKGTDKILYPDLTEMYQKEVESFINSEEYKAFSNPFKELQEYFSYNIGDPVDLSRMTYLTSGVKLLADMGKPLPEWINLKYPKPIEDCYKMALASKYGTRKLRRLMCGNFFKKIIEDTEMKINGTLSPSNRKMFLYSGHDLNIITLFLMLGVYDIEPPPVGSYCLLEVHKINGTFGFKLYYQNYTTTEPYMIQIPGYGDFVPIEKLKIQNREYLQVDEYFGSSHSTKSSGYLFIMLFISCLIVIPLL